MAFMDQAGQIRPVRLNPDGSVPVSDGTADDPAQQLAETMALILDEVRACRLALETMVNQGSEQQHDFLELSRSVRDAPDAED